MKHTVFVYGTLKKYNGNHGLLASSTTEPLGDAFLKGLNLVYCYGDSGFPVSYDDEGSTISGELYLVDDTTLTNLDMLEGAPDMYTQEESTAYLPDGSEMKTKYYRGTPSYWGDIGNNLDAYTNCPKGEGNHATY